MKRVLEEKLKTFCSPMLNSSHWWAILNNMSETDRKKEWNKRQVGKQICKLSSMKQQIQFRGDGVAMHLLFSPSLHCSVAMSIHLAINKNNNLKRMFFLWFLIISPLLKLKYFYDWWLIFFPRKMVPKCGAQLLLHQIFWCSFPVIHWYPQSLPLLE